MTTTDYTVIIGAVFLGLAKLLSMYLDYKREVRRVEDVRQAAAKVEEVAAARKAETTQTANKLEGIAATGDAVHLLVNSSMSNQLRISMVALHRVAELTKNPDDILAAELATKIYHEHEARQRLVDQSKTRGGEL